MCSFTIDEGAPATKMFPIAVVDASAGTMCDQVLQPIFVLFCSSAHGHSYLPRAPPSLDGDEGTGDPLITDARDHAVRHAHT